MTRPALPGYFRPSARLFDGDVIGEMSLDGGARSANVIAEVDSEVAIAARIGCSREMISRLLRDLAQGGFIEMSRQRIVIRKKLPARF